MGFGPLPLVPDRPRPAPKTYSSPPGPTMKRMGCSASSRSAPKPSKAIPVVVMVVVAADSCTSLRFLPPLPPADQPPAGGLVFSSLYHPEHGEGPAAGNVSASSTSLG